MSRTLSSTLSNASGQNATNPVYLVRMAWVTEYRIATYDVNITWNSETWTASGAAAEGLDHNGGVLILPMGNSTPWLNLIHTETARGRAIEVYEWQTDRTVSPAVSDAVLIFEGEMDQTTVSERGIRVNLLAGKQNKVFPPTSIGPPINNWLLAIGQRIFWQYDIVTVN